MERVLDLLEDRLAMDSLKRNPKPIRLCSLISLGLLFAPGTLFVLVIWLLRDFHIRFEWAHDFTQAPWQFWAMGLFGVIATLGGAGDWLFHKIYITVGPAEHHSHVLALSAGFVVFILMCIASIVDQPLHWLVPVIITLLVTATLICYDEFAFHVRRCKPFETMLHRMLVFGNATVFLIWMHWIFVEAVIYASQ